MALTLSPFFSNSPMTLGALESVQLEVLAVVTEAPEAVAEPPAAVVADVVLDLELLHAPTTSPAMTKVAPMEERESFTVMSPL
jgi:hypothetical protein